MRQNKIKAAAFGLCLAASAGAAHAENETISRGVYFGAGLGQSEAKEYDCVGRPTCENRGTVARFFAGWQFGRNWAVEVAGTDLGQVDSAITPVFNESIKVRLAEATLLASYPASSRFMIYAKGGAYYAVTTQDITQNGTTTRNKEIAGGPTWGAGLQYFVTGGLAVRGEAQRYMKVGGGKLGETDYNAFTLGILWKL